MVAVLMTAALVASNPVTVENRSGYNSWPMIQSVGNRLVCTYSRGTKHDVFEGVRGAWAKWSDDGGRTWNGPHLVADDPALGETPIGKGLDSTGAALFWIRAYGEKEKRHELYRTRDGVTFERIAVPLLDPMPVQITDVFRVPERGLVALWFAGNYLDDDAHKCWGELVSSDDGRTWTQRTIERDLSKDRWPTEPSVARLPDGRLLCIARSERYAPEKALQWQLESTDGGLTWTKRETNIRDVMASTPSLVYDEGTGLLHNYYYERGKCVLKRRVVRPEAVWGNPLAWPEPEIVSRGSDSPWDSGNACATSVGQRHYVAYYTGKHPDTSVVVAAADSCSPFEEFRGWEKKIVDEAVDIGAFANGSFEDASDLSQVKAHGELGRWGVNGGGGLRISDIKGNFGYALTLKAPLKKGVRYVFSADVRPHGKAFGRLAMDAYYRNPTRYASGMGAWHTNYGEPENGWLHESVEVVPKCDAEEIEYRFMVYCGLERGGEPGPENYVDVDNIKIESAAPKWYFCNVWPVHNQIYADEGRIRINSSFYGEFFGENAKPAYACRLVTEGGETLGERVATPDANGSFTLDFGRLGYAGKARLEATLYDRAARQERGSRTLDLEVLVPDRDTRLFVKENGVVLKDGKPFMPLGFYTGLADPKKHDLKSVEEHLRRMHEAGFDATMDYSCYLLNGKRRDDFYALYDKYGMWMLADDFKVWINDPKFDEKFPGWEKRAKELTKYPSIIGFYTMDENPEEAVPRLTRLRRMLNEVAPGRMVNICNIARPEPYLPACDIPGGDNYPVGPSKGCALQETHRRVSAMKACSDPAPIWWAPQCFNWARMTKGAVTNAALYRKSGREPTHEENLSVALCNVADGVTGFFFYAYFDLIECPVAEFREQRWNSMCEIAKVLRRLEPFIMSGEKIVDLPHEDRKDQALVRVLADGKGHRRVIVCGLGQQHETTFAIPADFGDLKPLLGNAKREDGRWVFRGKDFSCDLFE